jgi:hypothetical protein
MSPAATAAFVKALTGHLAPGVPTGLLLLVLQQPARASAAPPPLHPASAALVNMEGSVNRSSTHDSLSSSQWARRNTFWTSLCRQYSGNVALGAEQQQRGPGGSTATTWPWGQYSSNVALGQYSSNVALGAVQQQRGSGGSTAATWLWEL